MTAGDKLAEARRFAEVNTEAFLRGVVSSKTTYSEGWRDICAEVLFLRCALSAAEHAKADAEARAETAELAAAEWRDKLARLIVAHGWDL